MKKHSALFRALVTITVIVLGFVLINSSLFAGDPPRRAFGKARPFTMDELPDGKLKAGLQDLAPEAKDKAMKWLHTFTFPALDAVNSLRVDKDGGIFYSCSFSNSKHSCSGCGSSHDHAKPGPVSASPSIMESSSKKPGTDADSPSTAKIPVPPAYNSKPDAPYHIYLDFNGAIVTGKDWNSHFGVVSWDCAPWSIDGDITTFSDAEQTIMRQVWERISEDYAPFNVNVTTDVAYDPDNYIGDKNKVGWLLFTNTTDKNGNHCPHYNSGGVAYVGVFGRDDYFSAYQPAWVTPQSAANMSEAGTHEMGHNLNLTHDGTSTSEYYGGHVATASAPSWGPIMGTGYDRNVTQWSRGEYYDYSNPDQISHDDLAIIASYLTYRTDDHGDTPIEATPWVNVDGVVNQPGIIERTNDVDYFIFTTGAGTISFNANTYRCATDTWGANLDVALELYNESLVLVASNNPAAEVNASITYAATAGTYYLAVKPSGAGSPMSYPPSGYTVYGSLGQYTITGSFIPTDTIILTSPTGGEKWVRGTTHNITWASGMGGNVKIELYKADVLNQGISASTVNDGLYAWAIPVEQALGTDYKVRVTSLLDVSIWSESSTNFEIANPPIYYASMDTDPSWTFSHASWAYGAPTAANQDGIGKSSPSSGYNGANVIGYRLDGDYEANITATRWATTPVINCSNYENITLSFQRWLGVEGGYDNAYVQVSNNGTSWTQVWRSSTTAGVNNDDGAWVYVEYDISAVADGQSTVFVRWGMGTTDGDWNFCGWNLDEVIVDGDMVISGPAEMNVTRDASTILNGGTDLVAGTIAGLGTELTYAIANNGGENLTLTTPVSIPLQTNCSVTVNTEPSSPVASSASTSLVLTVTPAAAGAWSFDISIENNDPDKNPYVWTVSGTAAASYTVTYDGNANDGGNPPVDSNIYMDGNTVTVLDNTGNLVKTGLLFDGWNTAADGTGTDYAPGETFTMGTSDVTLYAKYSASYTLTVESGTGAGDYTADTLVAIAADSPAEHQHFVDWTTPDGGSFADATASSTNYTMPANNATVTANYAANTYTVTYDGNENTGGTVPVDAASYAAHDTVTVLGNTGTLVRTGYDFAGWNTAANGTGTGYVAGDTFAITSNVRLYAEWTAHTYTVSYDGNGATTGTAPGDQTKTHDVPLTLAMNTGTLAKTDYIFSGWNTASDGSGANYEEGGTYTANEAVILYAKWAEDAYELTVTSGTGSGIYASESVVSISASAAPLGYVFDVWTGDTGTITDITAANTTLTMPATNISVTATYREAPAGFTITAKVGPGGLIDPRGQIQVQAGADQRIRFFALDRYELRAVLVDGKQVPATGSYTFRSVSSDHQIEVHFKYKDSSGCHMAGEDMNAAPLYAIWVLLGAFYITYRKRSKRSGAVVSR